MMKILLINAVSGIRSTGRICADLADYLNQHGDAGYIAYSYGLPYEHSYRIGGVLEQKLHGFLSRLFGLQGYYSTWGTRKLISYIEALRPDAVHLHNLHGNYINLKLLLTYLADNDIPTVVTLHDCWFYTGKCCHYTVDNCFKWRSECHDCPRLHKDNPSWLLDRTRKMHRDKKTLFARLPRLAVIGVSDWITQEARQSLLASATMVTRIYNWIDFDLFQPVNTDSQRRKLGLDDKFLVLGVASSWSKDKGLDQFIALAGRLPQTMAMLLVGSLPPAVQLPANIIHIQETHDTRELIAYYSLADVFVNLSLEETFGKTAAEALACGTPVIAYRSTANPELIGDGCGHVVEPDSVAGLDAALEKVRQNGKAHYTDKCIAFASANFNKNDRLADHVTLYQELIKRRRKT